MSFNPFLLRPAPFPLAKPAAKVTDAPAAKAATGTQVKKPDTFWPLAILDRAIAHTPQAKPVLDSYQAQLGRAPTSHELHQGVKLVASMELHHKTPDEITAALNYAITNKPEFQARESYQKQLGRLPDGEELQKAKDAGQSLLDQGKSITDVRAAMDFGLAMSPEFQAKGSYQERLGRAPSAEELTKLKDFGQSQLDQGKTVPEMRAAQDFVVSMSPEWQAKDAYQAGLGRQPNADELQKAKDWGQSLLDQGKTVPEMRAAFDYTIALTPEWQAAHKPKLDTNRDDIYLQQPNGWSCGPTSLTMALAASGVKPSNLDTMWDVAGRLGARAGVGTPGGASLIADVARSYGVNAESSSSREPGDVRAALERGHGAVVNGDIGGGGHFIYISGLDAQGQYIVCDPYRPGITTWNDAQLNEFTHHGNNPPGFAEIWPN